MRLAAGAAVALAASAGLAACGGGKAGKAASAPLRWAQAPVAYTPPNLPTDRVVLAKVRNASSEPVRLDAAKLVVRDAAGGALRSEGRYIAGYAHGLYGAYQKPDPLPPDELKRLGLVITLGPGKTAPIEIAWRLKAGTKGPVHVDYGAGSLALPVRARKGS